MSKEIHWTRVSPHHVVSACGRFSVNVAGPVGREAKKSAGYLAWVRELADPYCNHTSGHSPWSVIGCFPDPAGYVNALRACEAYKREVLREA